ncbi:GNAT family acetyltransferase [Sphingomonas colocasiae]|uniref:GNAT family acetyltransferase n=1 Tax=Sphingomonas colocasiae TaxID=1848973 RepID=A0ABS7PRP4_9SPHN|nr:GNAT family acetyltransferase [Sphingomonas colocasiae]
MIAPLGLDAIPALVALWEACGLTRPWNDPASDARIAIEGPSSVILGLRDGDALAGSVMVGFDGHRGWVYYLAVAPDRRRAGLGRGLMRAAEAWLEARDCPAIRLMVRDDNVQALGFYAAIGYDAQQVVTIGKRLDGR